MSTASRARKPNSADAGRLDLSLTRGLAAEAVTHNCEEQFAHRPTAQTVRLGSGAHGRRPAMYIMQATIEPDGYITVKRRTKTKLHCCA